MSETNVQTVYPPIDEIIKTHINTYEIFANLKTKYSKIQGEIDVIEGDTIIINDAYENLEKGYNDIKHVISVYNDDIKLLQIDKYLEAFDELKKLNKSTNLSIVSILNNKKEILETEIDTVRERLNIVRKYITTGIEELINKDDLNKKFCPVCFDREVNIALVPCGHTYCHQCYDCDKNIKCPQCRSYISSTVKLYFSM